LLAWNSLFQSWHVHPRYFELVPSLLLCFSTTSCWHTFVFMNHSSKYYLMPCEFFKHFFFFFRTGFRATKGGWLIRLVHRGMRTGQALFPLEIFFKHLSWSVTPKICDLPLQTHDSTNPQINQKSKPTKTQGLKQMATIYMRGVLLVPLVF
jgi:hypothetical protein